MRDLIRERDDHRETHDSYRNKIDLIRENHKQIHSEAISSIHDWYTKLVDSLDQRRKVTNAGPAQRRDADLRLRIHLLQGANIFAGHGVYNQETTNQLDQIIPPPSDKESTRLQKRQETAGVTDGPAFEGAST
jgi:hypothetical protein